MAGKSAWLPAAIFTVSLLLSACGKKEPAPEATPPPPSEQPAAEAPAATPKPASPKPASTPAPRAPKPAALHTPPPPAELWKEFFGEKALAEVRKQVEIGPRPAGSPEAELARKHISESVAKWGWRVERQEFTEETPRGPIQFVNLIARHAPAGAAAPPTNTQQAIVCSHYDTKRFSTIQFVGASDGASSTGALLELARVLSLDPPLAARVELVFFDGEEALQQFTETDGLYGSRFYARTLRETGRARQFRFGILWDMIGDASLSITLPPDSPPDLAQGILSAAEILGVRKHFAYFSRSIVDDHIPLIQSGIPTIDLIDFDYAYWHTADDTFDKLSADSLQKVGAVTVYYLKKALH